MYSSRIRSGWQSSFGRVLSLRVGPCFLAALFLTAACATGPQSSGDSKGEGSGQAPRGRTDDSRYGFREGWTRLPPPSQWREGAAVAWTGSELLAWGGCDPVEADECVPTADGFAFDPISRSWSGIPEAPAPAGHPHALWTGEEAFFFGLQDEKRIDAQSYGPGAQRWRTIASAPIAPREGAGYVWSGTEVIVWGGGRHVGTESRQRHVDGAGDARLRILLDGRNYAATRTSVGAAYDPSIDAWRELPPSSLSSQATTAAWAGGRRVAWDYEVHSQDYDPQKDTWSTPQRMPLEFSECYPDSVAFDGLVFAFFCGRAAIYDPSTSAWQEIRGGPLEEEVWSDAYRDRIKVWRFASLASAGDAIFLLMDGLTLDDKGIACYGCEGSPVSFWAYRAPEIEQ